MLVAGVALLAALMLATVIVLVTGITLMARGGEANRIYGNKLMAARVSLQAASLVVVAGLLLLK